MKCTSVERRFAPLVAATVGVLLIFATMSAPVSVLAQPATDPEGDSTDPNFDIKTFGFKDDGKMFVQVYGKATRTLPSEDHMGLAYVFVTNDGVWAINGHREAHSTDVPQWHAERIFADGDCIQGIDVGTERTLIISGTNVMVRIDSVTEISAVQAVQFHLNVDEPDNPPPGTECIANVVEIFDEA